MIGCVDCARLKAEIADLKRAYGQEYPALGPVATALGLTRDQTRIVLILFYAKDWVSSHTLEARMDSTFDCLKTHICRIRRLVGREFIETQYAIGYRLSEAARRRVEAAL